MVGSACHPFAVYTDHKNFQYLKDETCLNPHQACWASFFTHFDYCIAYHPGYKFKKADGLTHLYTPEGNSDSPESILPPKVFVIPSNGVKRICTMLFQEIPRSGCPPRLQYIPLYQRILLITKVHTSVGPGHPGANQTLSLIKDKFWWPNMANEIRRFVSGCEVCAITKTPKTKTIHIKWTDGEDPGD